MSQFKEVKSTGKDNRQFNTGSTRDSNEGKGRYDLLSPIVSARDAVHMENGARKYDARNWEKGQPLSVFLDSAKRHLENYLEGHRDEDHLAAARWNIGAMIHCEEMVKRGLLPAELNDLPNYLSKTTPKISKGFKTRNGLRVHYRIENDMVQVVGTKGQSLGKSYYYRSVESFLKAVKSGQYEEVWE